MKLLYNVDFEVAAAAYLTILYFFLRLQYSAEAKVNIEFRRLTLFLLSADIMDVVSAVTISYGTVLPIWVNIVTNTVYLLLDVFLGYQCLNYIHTYVYKAKTTSFLLWCRVILAFYLMLLAVNTFTGIFFSMSPEGEYLHGPLYLLIYVFPYLYFLFSAYILFRSFDHLEKRQKISTVIYLFVGIGGPVLQLLVFPNVLLSVFSVSLGFMMLLFSMETPDYQKLMKTMKKLEMTKKVAESATQMAQEANVAKSEFLANMSHEIRTPINAILGMNEMVIRESKEPEILEYSRNIESAGKTLLSLISDVLDFSKIESGKMDLIPASYHLSSLLNDIYHIVIQRAEEKGLELRVEVDPQMPDELLGDQLRLSQVLLNVMNNAIKYTEHGSVTLNVDWNHSTENMKVIFRVIDTGIGIRKEEQSQLFDAFKRFDEKRNRSVEGSGLGLSIVSRIVDLMNGEIQVNSEYGEGSEFLITIPQKVVSTTPIGDYSQKLLKATGEEKNKALLLASKARILAVDDNRMNLRVLEGLLKRTQVRIDQATGGEQCIEMVRKTEYDLILLDHMMPGLDGIDTLKKLQEENLVRYTPVIALTANAVAGAREQYLEKGFSDYLSKPVRGEDLEKILIKWLPQGKQESPDQSRLDDMFREVADCIDLKKALQYSSDGKKGVVENIRFFINNAEVMDSDLSEAYVRGDKAKYIKLVHAITSHATMIGASGLVNVCQKIEETAGVEDGEAWNKIHADFMTNYRIVLGTLMQVDWRKR